MISQARILEWVTISFSRGSSQPRDRTQYLMHWHADSLPLRHQRSTPPPTPQQVSGHISPHSTLLVSESHSVVSNSLQPHGLHRPWNSPGQKTEVGSRSLLQGIFPTQGSNPGLLHCRRILYQLSHQDNPLLLSGAHKLSRTKISGLTTIHSERQRKEWCSGPLPRSHLKDLSAK